MFHDVAFTWTTTSTDLALCSVLDISPAVMAEQITLVEADYHNSILINELLELKWQKNAESAPNVMRASSRFNRFSRIVSTQILTADSPKQRAKIVGHFLAVAAVRLSLLLGMLSSIVNID